jgi:non-specific serine/threonine protein kinase
MDLTTSAGAEEGARWRFGNAEFDEATQVLRVDGEIIEIERKPLELLICLLRSAGEVLTKNELLEAVWPGRVVVEGALSVAVSKLRQALGAAGSSAVATVHGYGYRLVVPVERLGAPSAPPSIELKEGDAAPRRESWTLVRRLGQHGDVWLAAHAKTREQRVFKYSADGTRLSALKREATLSRLLRDVLGERDEFVRIFEWNFESAPFFLECEYGGVNLDEWAQSQGGLVAIPLEARLGLMAQIADAVGAAHAAGVLHKDLKPANVLVYKADGGGWKPRLTDFGSGRLLDPQQLSQLGITRLGFTQTVLDASSGTPLYVAPEVIAGRSPSAQSDVYALGVMLYQLAVGDFRRPLAPGWEKQIGDELLREDIGATADGDPERRLAAAGELAERLRTRDARIASRARLEEAEARARKAERALDQARVRRPWIIAAGLSLAVGLAVSLYLSIQASAARREASRAAETAQAINHFFNDGVLASADPFSAGNSAGMTVRAALTRAIERIDGQFAGRPDIEAAIRQTIGVVLNRLGEFGEAVTQQQKAMALYHQTGGPRDRRAALVGYELAQSLAMSSKLKDAEQILDNADASLGADGADAELVVAARHARGVVLGLEQKYEAAVPLLEEALRRQTQYDGSERQKIWALQQDLISAYNRVPARLADGEVLARQLITSRRTVESEHAPGVAYAKSLLGTVLSYEGKYEESDRLLREAYADVSRELGADSYRTLTVLSPLTNSYADRGRFDEAAPLAAHIHDAVRKRFGDDHQVTLLSLANVGILYLNGHDLDAATAPLERAFQGLTEQFGQMHPAVQMVGFYLGQIAVERGELKKATSLISTISADALNTAAPGEDWRDRLQLLKGEILLKAGQQEQARPMIMSAVASLQQNKAADWVLKPALALREAAQR